MNEILEQLIKKKVVGYIKGDLSASELFEWVKGREEFKGAVAHIKDKSDTIFFLINKAGLETRNFYIEEKIGIKREALVKNIKRLLAKEISSEELFNWADDIANWELIEGFEDDILKTAIREISVDEERSGSLSESDWKNIVWHLEKSKDEGTIPVLGLVFYIPKFRGIIQSQKAAEERLKRIEGIKNMRDDIYFDRFLNSLNALVRRNAQTEQFERFFDDASKGSLT